MVKLIAKQALDSSQLPGVAMMLKPHTPYYYDREDDHFQVAENARKEGTLLDVNGDGFRYLFSKPTGAGTVTEVNIRLDKDPYYSVTGLHVKLDSLFEASLDKATKLFFHGKDKFVGSPGDDIFDGREGKDKLLGKDGADTLYGRSGNDTLDGGRGNDVLSGGGGIDTYVFKTTDGADSIAKFKAGETIELGHKAFTALAKGELPADEFFVVGSGVQGENAHIVYSKGAGEVAGAIFYDSDGGGNAAAWIKITSVQPELKLGADDFLVI